MMGYGIWGQKRCLKKPYALLEILNLCAIVVFDIPIQWVRPGVPSDDLLFYRKSGKALQVPPIMRYGVMRRPVWKGRQICGRSSARQ